MVLKEYLLRSMVEARPDPDASDAGWPVGRKKWPRSFDVLCATSYDALLRQDPPAFLVANRA